MLSPPHVFLRPQSSGILHTLLFPLEIMATTALSQPNLMETDGSPAVSNSSTPSEEGNKPIVGIIYPPPNIRGTILLPI